MDKNCDQSSVDETMDTTFPADSTSEFESTIDLGMTLGSTSDPGKFSKKSKKIAFFFVIQRHILFSRFCMPLCILIILASYFVAARTHVVFKHIPFCLHYAMGT